MLENKGKHSAGWHRKFEETVGVEGMSRGCPGEGEGE